MATRTMTNRFKHAIRGGLMGVVLGWCCAGCILSPGVAATPNNIRLDFTPPATEASSEATEAIIPAQPATLTPFPFGLEDALPVMSGICYDAAFDARDQVFVIRNAEDHINFYDLADNSQLCSRPVVRYPFDFRNGDVLAGLWSYGMGCKANHRITAFERDDTEKAIEISAEFYTEGDCNYELVRPFWIRIPNASEHTINIIVDN